MVSGLWGIYLMVTHYQANLMLAVHVYPFCINSLGKKRQASHQAKYSCLQYCGDNISSWFTTINGLPALQLREDFYKMWALFNPNSQPIL